MGERRESEVTGTRREKEKVREGGRDERTERKRGYRPRHSRSAEKEKMNAIIKQLSMQDAWVLLSIDCMVSEEKEQTNTAELSEIYVVKQNFLLFSLSVHLRTFLSKQCFHKKKIII